MCVCVCVCVCDCVYLSTPLHKQDVAISKRKLTGWNSEFSFT